jgi:hypothetical protein
VPGADVGTWNALLSWCRSELAQEKRRGEWEEVRRRRADLAALASPAEVLELLDRRSMGAASEAVFSRRDRVLISLIEEHRDGYSSVIRPLLLLAFAPSLIALHRRFPRDIANGDLLDAVVEAFLDRLATYPVERRRSKVALNIARDTEKSICRLLKSGYRQAAVQREVAEELLPRREELESREHFDLAEELRPARRGDLSPDDVEESLQILDALARRGVISEVERHLLGASVRGVVLKAWVATRPQELAGMSYEAAKKRLQRAAKRVRDRLKIHALRLSRLL